MSEQRRIGQAISVVTAGAVIGAVETVLAVSFAAFIFGGFLAQFLADAIGLYLLAGALTLAIVAWRAGARGVIGSVQDAAAVVLAVVATSTSIATSFVDPKKAFLSVIAATMVVTLLTGATFLALGVFRWGNLIRFVPYPVVGGFLAGTGWLLAKGGVTVAAGLVPSISAFHELAQSFLLQHWVPAVGFGVFLLLVSRLVKWPLAIPVAIAMGFVGFAIGMAVTGLSLNDALNGGWMLGRFDSHHLLHPWTLRALSGADWTAVAHQAPGIATAIFVAVIAALFNMSGIELLLHTDLDTNRELRAVGVTNLVSGPFGGIPGYHALSLTALANRLNVSARAAGFVAALVPLAAVLFAAGLVEIIPTMLVAGVLIFLGLSFLLDWVILVRRTLPIGEYLILLAILVTIANRGLLPGVEVGLVLAIVLFVVNYSRVESVREVEFGSTYRSNVDRPAVERAALEKLADRVEILRVDGFVFFGTATRLLERIRKRVEAGPVRFLVVDLRRVTGMDSSAVLSFRKVAQLTEANRAELVFTGASDRVQKQLRRGGVVASGGIVSFEPDLDHGLQRCEDGLLETDQGVAAAEVSEVATDMPAGLEKYLERTSITEGTVLIRQGEPSDDLFVLESGRLNVEVTTPDGDRMRLRSMRPGVVVGEVAFYTGVRRTADVVAETPCVVQRLSRDSIRKMEAEAPALAAALHWWLAKTLAGRLGDAVRAFDALLD